MAIAPWMAGVGGRPELVGAPSIPTACIRPISALPEATVSMQPTWPHTHGRVAAGHRDVADLAGRAERPADDLAVEHEPGGDAGADAEVGQARAGRRAELDVRPERGGVDVVLDVHGHAERVSQQRPQRRSAARCRG